MNNHLSHVRSVDCWYAAWNGGLCISDELERFWKEAVMAGIVNNELVRICKESVSALSKGHKYRRFIQDLRVGGVSVCVLTLTFLQCTSRALLLCVQYSWNLAFVTMCFC